MEEYVTVRGCQVPAQEIQNLKDQFGAELVPDSEWRIIRALDMTLKHYRAMHGKDPDLVKLNQDPFYWYKHCPLNVVEPVTKAKVPAKHKPAWFRIKRIFKVVKP
ncbi:MAG: hypothetical protein A2W25_11805 [candidate division Zixibacteria bacterium RBG_16_53_22]|nr:MAG: hypothetical protein A2W25_11805 [candidate division Zixibacteria bacterium RBG_16_53_22]